MKSLLNFTKNIYKSLTLSYFANCLQIDIVHHLIVETLLSGDSNILELTCSCIIHEFRKDIVLGKLDEKTLRNAIWREIKLKNI